MSRDTVIENLAAAFDDGGFLADLARRVAIPTESQVPASHAHLRSYLADEIGPALSAMDYAVEIFDNPEPGGGPFLIGRSNRSAIRDARIRSAIRGMRRYPTSLSAKNALPEWPVAH